MYRDFQAKKRVVVKVGSSILVDESGRLTSARCRRIAAQIAELRSRGIAVILVSSGAIAAGLHQLNFKKKPESVSVKQAIAAAGQITLMKEYERAFAKYQIKIAQILLTREDLSDRGRFLNARHALEEILKLGLVPIVNENDTVAVEEIKVGDNDNLSALVTHLVAADLLIILSDVAGVFDRDPRLHPDAKRLSTISDISEALKRGASDTLRLGSTGGMRTKIEAAERAREDGVTTVIADGNHKNILLKILNGEDVGTAILPKPSRKKSSSGETK